MTEWVGIADEYPPEWKDVRVRYQDGRESIGQFWHHDLGAEWSDNDISNEDWPRWWAPISEPPKDETETAEVQP